MTNNAENITMIICAHKFKRPTVKHDVPPDDEDGRTRPQSKKGKTIIYQHRRSSLNWWWCNSSRLKAASNTRIHYNIFRYLLLLLYVMYACTK